MAQFRKQLDAHRGPVSCALVALMAHGGPQGKLLGADGQERQLEVLVQELSHCGALRGRPKIFLFQACRGLLLSGEAQIWRMPWRWVVIPKVVLSANNPPAMQENACSTVLGGRLCGSALRVLG